MIKKDNKFFTFYQYNSPFEDFNLLIKDKKKAQNILIDCGDIGKYPLKDLLKLKYLFVSHFHMDHFIGLAYLLQCFLNANRTKPFYIYGPENLIKRVSACIDSFTWNLLDDHVFKLCLTEITTTTKKILYDVPFYKIPTSHQYIKETVLTPTLIEHEHFKVEYIILSHKIPVMGYKLIQKPYISYLGHDTLSKGKWINTIKNYLVNHHTNQNISVTIDNAVYDLKDLTPYFKKHSTYQMVYLTDFLYQENTALLIKFISKADLLFIENHFIEKDHHLAEQTYHLSSKDVKDIIKKSEPKEFILCHFSRRYKKQYTYDDFLKLVID